MHSLLKVQLEVEPKSIFGETNMKKTKTLHAILEIVQ